MVCLIINISTRHLLAQLFMALIDVKKKKTVYMRHFGWLVSVIALQYCCSVYFNNILDKNN